MSVFHNVEPNSPEHRQMRVGIPTSSSFDRIITPKRQGPSSQAFGYMCRKLAEWIINEPLEDEEYRSRWMDRGTALEDQAVAAYEGLAEVETEPGGFWTLDSGMAGCSPDRMVGKEGVLEIKCPLLSTQVRAALEGVEADHLAQIQGQLWITGRQWVDVFSYHPAFILPAKRVMRDERFIEKLAAAVAEFVVEMLRRRADLEREHGPFLRWQVFPAPAVAPGIPPAEDLITDADVETLFRLRREQRT